MACFSLGKLLKTLVPLAGVLPTMGSLSICNFTELSRIFADLYWFGLIRLKFEMFKAYMVYIYACDMNLNPDNIASVDQLLWIDLFSYFLKDVSVSR